MPEASRKRLRGFVIIYAMLLLYIIAALVWWFISLSNQNNQMRDLRIARLQATTDSLKTPGLFQTELHLITDDHKRNGAKYIGEGSIFLLFIIIGAAFLYRSVRRQFYMQQQQQNFMMAVTHELKTPISITKLNLETIQKYSLDEEKQKKLVKVTLEETARLDFLTNNILIVSQLEGRRYQSTKEELDLSDLIADCINDFKSRYSDRILIENIQTDVNVKGDALLLKMLTNNLLENANKYSPKGYPIKITLQKINSTVSLSIIDEGAGIPDSEKKKIFTKFYRIGNENTRKTQGSGLGLYLCKKIAKDHNADIAVTNNASRGSNFTVIFPGFK